MLITSATETQPMYIQIKYTGESPKDVFNRREVK